MLKQPSPQYKTLSLLSLIGLLLFIAFQLVQSIQLPQGFTIATDESSAKKQWEKEMLQDPTTGTIPEGIRYKELAFLNNYPRTANKRGNDWRLRGPWNVGGRTRSMAIDILDENHFIAGAVSGGLWQTKDGGQTWKKVSAPNGHPGFVSIAQDKRPGYEKIWYALSGEIYGTSASGTGAFFLGDGAFRSLDNGETWQSLGATAGGNADGFSVNFQGGWRIVTSPADGAVYMATYGSVYRSVDSGNSWTAVVGNGNTSYFTDVAVSKSGIAYAAFSQSNGTPGFYRSIDGINWTNITPANFTENNRSVIEIDPNNENIVYFLTEMEKTSPYAVGTANYEGVLEYVSLLRYTYQNGNGSPTSGGGRYDNLSANLPTTGIGPFDLFNCQGGYDLCIRVLPGNSNIIFIGGTNLYRNTNAFNTATSNKQIGGYGVGTALPFFTIYPNHHPDQHDVYFSASNPKIIFSVSDGGIKKTNDALASTVNWQDISLGYVTTQCYTVNIDEKNKGDKRMMVGLQDNGNFVTLNDHPQQAWRMPVNGDGAFGYISGTNDFWVTSIQLGRIVKMKLDDRGNMVRRRRIDPAGKSKNDYAFINPFCVDPNDENFMYLPIGRKLYRLDNLTQIPINNNYSQLADAWKEIGEISTANIVSSNNDTTYARISCLAASNSPANILYLGTNNQEIYRVENANSANPVFIKTSTLRLPPRANVNDIAIDPDDANKVLVCYSNYGVQSLVYSTDGGQNWYFAGGTLESSNNPSGSPASVRSVAILKTANGRKYFAGTSIGLFSTDSINTQINLTDWAQESPGLIGANIVTDIKVRHQDGFVAAATHGNGVFESYYTSVQQPVTSAIQLIANAIYPIPTSGELNYAFTTGGEANILLQIMNMSGQLVYRKSLGLHIAGSFNYSVNLSHLRSGMYFLGLFDADRNQGAVQKIMIAH